MTALESILARRFVVTGVVQGVGQLHFPRPPHIVGDGEVRAG